MERKGGWEERRRRLMFNWKRYAGFSLICARKCRLSVSFSKLFPSLSHFSPFPSHFFLSSFLLSLKNAISVFFLASRLPFLSFCHFGLSFFFPWSFLPASHPCVVLLPLSAQQWFDAALLSLVWVRVLSCTHVHWSLLCEFDTSKGCHELNKSIPSSVLHWQN